MGTPRITALSLSKTLEGLRRDIAAACRRLQELEQRVGDAQGDLAHALCTGASRQADALEDPLAAGDRHGEALAILRDRLRRDQIHLAELRARLATESTLHRYWEARARAILASSSWRLTRPIRWALDRLRGNRATDELARLRHSLPGELAGAMPHELALRTPPLVDVIVCVHGRLDVVAPCIDSVLRFSTLPMRLIVIDDASDEETRRYLAGLDHPHLTLHRNGENLGYTRSANLGLALGGAPFRLLLNSDTLVSRGWLERLLRCMESDPDVAVVGPVSNSATYQSVPRIRIAERPDAAWSDNPLAVDLGTWSEVVAALANCRYPALPNLHGMCWLVRASALERLGLFDPEWSPVGYGEENEFARRVEAAGLSCRVADDCFVFHRGGSSFGERAPRLMAAAHESYIGRYGRERLEALEQRLEDNAELAGLRRRLRDLLSEGDRARTLFLLPYLGWYGGVLMVLETVRYLRRLGIEARIASPENQRSWLDPADGEAVLFYRSASELLSLAAGFDAVVATHHLSVRLQERVLEHHPRLVPFYFIQDYEPTFHLPGSELFEDAVASYTRIPGNQLYAYSAWLAELVGVRHGCDVELVPGGIDLEVYDPSLAGVVEEGRLRIGAMVRPSTPWRAPRRTLRVLEELQRRYGAALRLVTFGCSGEELAALDGDVTTEHHGMVPARSMFGLLHNIDIFVDLSDHQAYGRTALEAMAAGCVVVVPTNGGCHAFARHRVNALVCDSHDEAAVLAALDELIDDARLREGLRRQAVATALDSSVVRSAIAQYALIRDRVRRARAVGLAPAAGAGGATRLLATPREA